MIEWIDWNFLTFENRAGPKLTWSIGEARRFGSSRRLLGFHLSYARIVYGRPFAVVQVLALFIAQQQQNGAEQEDAGSPADA